MRLTFICCFACIVVAAVLAQERRYTGSIPKSLKTTTRRPRGRPADRFRQPTPPTLPPDFTPPTPPKAEKLTPPTPPTPPQPLFLQPVTQPAVPRPVGSTPSKAPQELDEDYVVGESEPTKDPRLTGDPRKDYIYDPNLPRELNGVDLSTYPFYISVPTDISFDCAGRHDGYYASIQHHCQLFHYCVGETRYDFLCANYTLFDQTTFTCRFVNNVNCTASEDHYDRNNALYEPTTTTTEKPPPRRRKQKPKPKPVEEEEEYDDEAEEYDDEYDEEEEPTTTTTRKPRRKTGRGSRRPKPKTRIVPPKRVNTRRTTTTTTTTTEPPQEEGEGEEYYDEPEE